MAADASDVATFLAAFGVDEVAGWEQRSGGGRGAEDDVAGADVLFQQALVFRVGGREDSFLRPRIVLLADGVDEVGIVGERVVEAHEASSSSVEAAGDDVEVVNLVASQEQSQADVPVCLLAAAEDCDVVDGLSLFEEHG